MEILLDTLSLKIISSAEQLLQMICLDISSLRKNITIFLHIF